MVKYRCKHCLHYNVCGDGSEYWDSTECKDFLSKKEYEESMIYKEICRNMYYDVLDALLSNRFELIKKIPGRDI